MGVGVRKRVIFIPATAALPCVGSNPLRHTPGESYPLGKVNAEEPAGAKHHSISQCGLKREHLRPRLEARALGDDSLQATGSTFECRRWDQHSGELQQPCFEVCAASGRGSQVAGKPQADFAYVDLGDVRLVLPGRRV